MNTDNMSFAAEESYRLDNVKNNLPPCSAIRRIWR